MKHKLTAASGTTRCTATCTPAASWVHSASTASARSGGGANSWYPPTLWWGVVPGPPSE